MTTTTTAPTQPKKTFSGESIPPDTTAGHTSAMPHYLHAGQFSAYGTSHPIDVALGKFRRRSGLHAASHGGAGSMGDALHLARSLTLGDG